MTLSATDLRRYSEHNNGELSTLTEVSLHQLQLNCIDPIIARCCPLLQQLLMSNNNIKSLSNIKRLHHLKYLNVSINKIEIIPLECMGTGYCEELEKLDLTCNLISTVEALLVSLQTLSTCYKLKELHLVGNPVTYSIQNYRQLVIGILPQLMELDGKFISPSERTLAVSNLDALLISTTIPIDLGRVYDIVPTINIIENPATNPCTTTLATRLRQQNSWKLVYFIDDIKKNTLQINIEIPKNISTSSIDVDIHPTYIIVDVCRRPFILHFDDDVCPDSATIQRSQITGQLCIAIPTVQKIGLIVMK